jgi:hypothetical protein
VPVEAGVPYKGGLRGKGKNNLRCRPEGACRPEVVSFSLQIEKDNHDDPICCTRSRKPMAPWLA